MTNTGLSLDPDFVFLSRDIEVVLQSDVLRPVNYFSEAIFSKGSVTLLSYSRADHGTQVSVAQPEGVQGGRGRWGSAPTPEANVPQE